VSLYVLHSEKVYIECDMEYSAGKDVSCIIRGATAECVKSALAKINGADYITVKGGEEVNVTISTSVFKAGKTPGELIRELFILLRAC